MTALSTVWNVGRLLGPAVRMLAERRRTVRAYRQLHFERCAAGPSQASARAERSELLATWYIPCVMGAYSRLLGRRLSPDERRGLSLFGLFSTAYDDLFDERGITESRLREVLTEPSCVPASMDEALAGALYRELVALPSAKDNGLFADAFRRQHAAQFASLAQQDPSISTAELEGITYAKGGAAQLLTHSLVNPGMSPEEQAATFELGAWGQLVNDCADIHKDRSRGVSTLMTRTSTFTEALGWLEKYRLRFFARYRALPEYPVERKEQFLFEYYAICAAMVARLREGYGRDPATRRPRRKRDWLPAALEVISGYDRRASERPMRF